MASPQLLSASRIRAAKVEAKQRGKPVWLSDDIGLRGFGRLVLRVMPNGTSRFYFRIGPKKERRLEPLGVYSRTQVEGRKTIEQARVAAQNARRALVEALPRANTVTITGPAPKTAIGESHPLPAIPARVNDEVSTQPADTFMSVRHVCELYIAKLENKDSPGAKKTARDYLSLFEKHIYSSHIAPLAASALTTDDFVDLLRDALKLKGASVGAIDRLREGMHAAYNHARKVTSDPRQPKFRHGLTINPISPVPKVDPSRARERWLEGDELGYFWILLNATGESCPDPVIRLLRLDVLLGGQRCEQLTRAERRHTTSETITLFDQKGGRKIARPHLLPFTELAKIEVAWHLNRAESVGSNYLFPGSRRNTTMHASNITHQVTEISRYLIAKKKIKEPFQFRDIRRTTETALEKLGVHKDIRAQIESHGLTGVQEKHYGRHTYVAEKLRALKKWEKHLASLASRLADDRAWLDDWIKAERASKHKLGGRQSSPRALAPD